MAAAERSPKHCCVSDSNAALSRSLSRSGGRTGEVYALSPPPSLPRCSLALSHVKPPFVLAAESGDGDVTSHLQRWKGIVLIGP